MNSGRRRGFTDLIIRSLGAAASAASPVAGEAAGGEGLRAKSRATPPLQPAVPANGNNVNQQEEEKKP
ncbi:MAG: hypothetical protein ACKVOI_00145 [Dongiaceae bacterium]